jgi:hypothetical protein
MTFKSDENSAASARVDVGAELDEALHAPEPGDPPKLL